VLALSWVYASFGGEWVRLISAQLTPFVFYTEKITSPVCPAVRDNS
jgi:hypothetical protein